jgi:lipopolysaccharide export system permease protein
MGIIDRYLLRQFVQAFFICFFSLTGLYVVFDAFTNLEEFMRCAEGQQELLELMAGFYGYRSIYFFDRTAGLLTLIAAMLTVTLIQRHNEMTALMAAGISRFRIALPVIAVSVCIAVLATFNRELVIPQCREQLSRTATDPLGMAGAPLQPRYDNQTDILIRGKTTYAGNERISEPNFLLPSGLNRYGKQLVADEAFYRPPEGDRPGGYLLKKVSRPKHLAQRPSLSLDGRPVIITPRDAPDWLQGDQCFVVSKVNFEQLTGGLNWRQYASTSELIAGLYNPSLDFGADVRVTIHSRIVQPLLDITLLFLGLPLVIAQKQRNVFIAIGMCMGVVTVFIAVAIAFQYLGSSYLLSPALAVWMPLIIFVPVAAGMGESMWR